MADPKKVLLMLPDGTEAYFPEQNKQAAIDQGAKEPVTQAPPGIVTGVISGLAKDAKGKSVDPIIEKAATAGPIALDALAGFGTSLTGIPGQVMRLFGGDPKSVVIPGVYETTKNGEKIPSTLESIGKPPDSTAGKVGAFAGDVAQVALGEGAVLRSAQYGLAKLPQIGSAFSKLMTKAAPLVKATETGIGKYAVREPLRYAARAVGGAPVSAIHLASKTGDVESAVESAKSGAKLDAALNIFGRVASKSAKGGLSWIAKSVLPKTTIGEEAQEGLAKRLMETASDFSKEGLDGIKKRFQNISNNMESAAEEGDKWLREASVLKFQNGMQDPSGMIKSDARIADFPTKIAENWDKFKKQQGWDSLLLEEKVRLEKLFSGFMEVIPNKGMQGLTLKEANDQKREFYLKLHSFYDKAKNPNYQITEAGEEVAKMRELFARTLKETVQDGLGDLRKIRSQITPPSGTMVDKAQPWNVKVAPDKFADIKEAGILAGKDADLLAIGTAARNASGPQSGNKSAQSLVTMVSVSQVAHGKLFGSPSQFAALTAAFQGGVPKTTKLMPALRKISTATPPVSAITGTTAMSIPFRKDQPESKPSEKEDFSPLSK